MAITAEAVAPSGLLLGSNARNQVSPALSRILKPGASPSVLAWVTVHLPGAGPSVGERTADRLLNADRPGKNAIGEPAGIGHLVDGIDIFRARAPRVLPDARTGSAAGHKTGQFSREPPATHPAFPVQLKWGRHRRTSDRCFPTPRTRPAEHKGRQDHGSPTSARGLEACMFSSILLRT